MATPVPAWFYDQSSAVPVVRDDEGVRLVIVTSRKGKRWIFPKGVIEPDLTPQESAAQEAFEEAGVTGEIGAMPIGSYEYEKWGGTCSVKVYALDVGQVHATWEEMEMRERRILAVDDALDLVADEVLEAMVRSFLRS